MVCLGDLQLMTGRIQLGWQGLRLTLRPGSQAVPQRGTMWAGTMCNTKKAAQPGGGVLACLTTDELKDLMLGPKEQTQASGKVQQVNSLASKPDNLGLVPQDPHGRSKSPAGCPLTPTHAPWPISQTQ